MRKSLFVTLGTLSTIQVIGVPGWAQPTPANDATGTQVTIDGTVFTIDGGTFSGDGGNLFHSFQDFGLESGQIANFLTNPQVMNVLGRVVGGEASSINGLLQLSGSNANLFLMNPAGVVFGADAQLNIPGSFIVTTGNGIQFGDAWFSADGENSFADLTGNPSGFGFALEQAGSIINAGELSVPSGESLVLLGDAVANTGELTASSGQIVVTAVPGEQFVQLSMPGSLLSLGVSPIEAEGSQPNSWNIPVASLPELLTVGTSDLGLTANNDSTVQLTESGINVPGESGTAVVSGVVDVSGDTAGDVGVFGEQVALVSSEVQASGETGGGNVLIGGDYRGEGTVPNALRTYVSSTTNISADAIDSGDGGRVIIWSDEATGFYGDISARGGRRFGNGGFSEISSPEVLVFEGLADLFAPNGTSGTLLLDPQDITISDRDNTSGVDDRVSDSALSILQEDNNFDRPDIDVNKFFLESIRGDIRLEATNNINVETGLNFFLAPQVSFIADADNDGEGNFTMEQPLGGFNIEISAANVRLGGVFFNGNLGVADNQSLTIRADGRVDTSDIGGNIFGGTGFGNFEDGGTIEISTRNPTADGLNVVTGNLIGSGYGDGGTISISAPGSIDTGKIESRGGLCASLLTKQSSPPCFRSTINSGDITLLSDGNIRVESINSESATSQIEIGRGSGGDGGGGGVRSLSVTGGDVRITSTRAGIRITDLISESSVFSESDISISTRGNALGSNGSVTIFQGEGLSNPEQRAFRVQDSLVPSGNANGTFGTITSGENTLPAGIYEDSIIEGNISLEIASEVEPIDPDGDDNPFDNPKDLEGNGDNSNGIGPETASDNEAGGAPGVAQDVPSPEDPGRFDRDTGEAFKDTLGLSPEDFQPRTLNDIYGALTTVEDSTGIKPAIVYASFVPLEVEEGELIHTRTTAEKATDQLELVVVTAGREPIRRRIHGTSRANIIKTANDLREEVSKKRPNYKLP
ncbi:MAG: filamentous hemagglutinin N-terminal domain-containing protein [Cyanobacteria bacterium J06560_5]